MTKVATRPVRLMLAAAGEGLDPVSDVAADQDLGPDSDPVQGHVNSARQATKTVKPVRIRLTRIVPKQLRRVAVPDRAQTGVPVTVRDAQEA